MNLYDYKGNKCSFLNITGKKSTFIKEIMLFDIFNIFPYYLNVIY